MDQLEIEYMKHIPSAGGADVKTTAKVEVLRKMLFAYRQSKTAVKTANDKAEYFEQEWMSRGGDMVRLGERLAEAVAFLRECKAQFAPRTTNSLVDDFLSKFDALGRPLK